MLYQQKNKTCAGTQTHWTFRFLIGTFFLLLLTAMTAWAQEPVKIAELQQGDPVFVVQESILKEAAEQTIGNDIVISTVSISYSAEHTYFVAAGEDGSLRAIELDVDDLDIICVRAMDSHSCTGTQGCTCCAYKRNASTQEIIGCECNEYPNCTHEAVPWCTHTLTQNASTIFLENLHNLL